MFLKKIKLSENNKNVLFNIGGAFLIRGLSLILSLFSMPAYIRFFNNDTTLGLWFTILSVLNWILNFDLGIGNGLRNYLSKAWAEKKWDEAKKYISSAYLSIGAFCILLSVIFAVLFQFVNWNFVFNISETSVSDQALKNAVLIVFIGILLQLFVKLISSVIYAIQKSAINNFLGLITSLFTVISLYVLPPVDNDVNLIVMAWVHLLAAILPQLIATIIIFANKKYRPMSPSLKCFDWKYAKAVLSLGGIFLYVQIAYMVVMSTNEYTITAFIGSEPVVEYQIYYRLFTLVSTLFTLAMAPIWSSVTKALAEFEYKWIRSLFKKAILIGAIFIVGNFLVIPLSQFVINIWLGDDAISVNYFYAFSFAILGALMTLNCVLSTFANGAGKLKAQTICFTIGALIKIPIAGLLVFFFQSWISIVWANNVALIIYCIIEPILLTKYMKRLSENTGD